MRTTTNMSLGVWDLITDQFSHVVLQDNFDKIDAHDHSSGRGAPIASAGINDAAVTTNKIAGGAITNPKLGANAVTTDKILDGTITNSDLSTATLNTFLKLGVVGNAKVDMGTAQLHWNGGSNQSARLTVNHTLGITPTVVITTGHFIWGAAWYPVIAYISNSRTTTSFDVIGSASDGSQPSNGTTNNFSWLVVGFSGSPMP